MFVDSDCFLLNFDRGMQHGAFQPTVWLVMSLHSLPGSKLTPIYVYWIHILQCEQQNLQFLGTLKSIHTLAVHLTWIFIKLWKSAAKWVSTLVKPASCSDP